MKLPSNILNADTAYVLGLLHDIGRREGVTDMRHIVDGYRYMKSLGYDICARICLTHSFPYKDIRSYNGQNDCAMEETEFIKSFLDNAEYDDYDRLIQLCDSISGAEGVMDMIERMSDVKRRYGNYDPGKWDRNLELRAYFENRMHMDLYEAVEKDTFRP